jgi:uncharacterized membrane protein YccC
VHVTGFDALSEDSGDSDGPGVLVEAVIGGVGALLVLLFVFASVLAVVPLLMAFVSIMTASVPLLALTALADVSPMVQFLIVLIGLGVAIDYSLLVVSRWREERSHGAPGDDAVQRAMETAGRRRLRRRDRGDRTAGADRAAAAVPALDGLRRHADPARLRARGDHAAARRAGEGRSAPGLAAPAQRRQGEPGVDPLGACRRPAALAGGRRGRRPSRSAGSGRSPRRRSPSQEPAARRPTTQGPGRKPGG